MFTADERQMHKVFETELGQLLDKYVALGMDLDVMAQELSLEAAGRLWDRRDDLGE